MKSSVDKLADVLNGLSTINNDRIEGYHRAAEETNDGDLKKTFQEMASHSLNFQGELTNQLHRIGTNPTQETTTSGKAFRVWMDIKAGLTGKDRHAILASCETGEDAALKAYNEALQAPSIEGGFRQTLDQQRQILQQDHDRIKSLRDATGS